MDELGNIFFSLTRVITYWRSYSIDEPKLLDISNSSGGDDDPSLTGSLGRSNSDA